MLEVVLKAGAHLPDHTLQEGVVQQAAVTVSVCVCVCVCCCFLCVCEPLESASVYTAVHIF